MIGAGGQQRISEQFVLDYKQYIPSLEQQLRIADYLDDEIAKIDELIAAKKRLLEVLSKNGNLLLIER